MTNMHGQNAGGDDDAPPDIHPADAGERRKNRVTRKKKKNEFVADLHRHEIG